MPFSYLLIFSITRTQAFLLGRSSCSLVVEGIVGGAKRRRPKKASIAVRVATCRCLQTGCRLVAWPWKYLWKVGHLLDLTYAAGIFCIIKSTLLNSISLQSAVLAKHAGNCRRLFGPRLWSCCVTSPAVFTHNHDLNVFAHNLKILVRCYPFLHCNYFRLNKWCVSFLFVAS